MNNFGGIVVSKNRMHDVFPLQIRLSASEGAKLLKAKLTRIVRILLKIFWLPHLFCGSVPLRFSFDGSSG